ncbi:MAG: hypothetical protein IT162_13100 [Bryobacterales bacterium]|nr:hypothetical protein [Bryobacterales bacterium]
MRPMWLAMAALLLLSGCVRRDGRNPDCRWVAAPSGPLDLRGDLELAEELAIRYMDAHVGPGDPEAAAQAKNRCMGTLLDALGKVHGLTAQEAFRSFGQRSAGVDLAMAFPFLLFYLYWTNFALRRLRSLHPAGAPLWLTIGTAIVFAAAGCLLAQLWLGWAESLRVGTTHLSNRTFRLPANRYPLAVFALGLVLFGGVAVLRRTRPAETTAAP